MESKAKVMGHPVHPILVPFPIGLLTTSVIFDVVHLLAGGARWAEISFWMIAVGVMGGLLAAVFGLIDWLGIPSGTRAKAIGLGHGLSNVSMVALFAVSWLLRSGDPGDPGVLPIVLSFAGVGSRFFRGLPRGRAGLPDGHRGGGRGEPERFGIVLWARRGRLGGPRGVRDAPIMSTTDEWARTREGGWS